MKIYTIGTSNRSIEEFINILKSYGIKNVVDVRRFPTSKFSHFKKENLEKYLENEGIKYIYLGDLLGGYRKEGYEKYMETEEFEKGIERLKKIAEKQLTTIMCSERFPWRCHRRFISKKLKLSGIEVVHIIEKNKIWKN
ncbi:MAG: DUF488 domain-containing protein [Candidatus Omnitrophota bacterium]|nr:MAG: DUF488 domain-containing protein [Candidatus Omnitrophota bacterium]